MIRWSPSCGQFNRRVATDCEVVFLAQQHSLMRSRRVTLLKVGCTDASMSNFSYCLLKSRTAVSARFGQGVALPVGIVLTPCVFQNVIQEGVKKAISATTHFGLQECMCIHSLKRSCVTGSVPSCCVAPHRRLVAPSRTKKS